MPCFSWCTASGVSLLCCCDQGLSPDAMLAKVTAAKTEVRRGLLKRHMQTLDESEGLQDVTSRLSDRLGIGAFPCNHATWQIHSTSQL